MDIIRLFGGGFPLTIERLQFLQETYGKAISQLTRLAGNGKIIIDGTVLNDSATPTTVTDGVIIVDGEIIEFRGGAYNDRVAIFETVDDVPYNEDLDSDGNLDLKASDVVRFAQCAATGGLTPFQFDDLTRVGNLQTVAPIVGEIKMFFGAIGDIPQGWVICDGNNGTPNFAGRFPVGTGVWNTGSVSVPYDVGDEGGEFGVELTKQQLPSYNLTGTTYSGGGHSHGYRDGYFIEAFPSPNDVINGYDSELVGNNFRGSGDTDADNRYIWYKNRTTNYQSSHTHGISLPSGGSNQAHENRPPFIAVHFIMFKGF